MSEDRHFDRASAALAVDRSRLPIPGPTQPITFPPIRRSVIGNGLRIWTVHHPQLPVVTMHLLVRTGSADDPSDRPGLAALTADMLDEGSGSRSAIEMHEEMARIGSAVDINLGSDGTLVGCTVLSRFADRAMALIGDCVVRPAFRPGDFSRVLDLRLHRLKQLRDAPGAIADRALVKLLYGDHPYGHTPIGSAASLRSLSIDDVKRHHQRVLRPSTATLIAVGDCSHEEIHRLAEQAFGDWEGELAAAGSGAAPPAPARLAVVDRPSAPQSEVRIGQVAAAHDTPDYHALVVGNMVLGGQFVSRINLNLREDKGITYGARTMFEFRRRPGPFALQVSVETGATAAAIRESMAEISAMRGGRPVTDAERRLAVAALTRGYARNFETGGQIARALTELALYELPDGFFETFVPRVENVTIEDITRVVAAYLDPTRLTTVVVGDLDRIGADLRGLGLGEPLVLPVEGV